MRPSITRTEVVDLRPDDVAELHDLRTRASDFFSEVGDEPPTPESLQADLDDLPEGYSRADEVMYRAYRDGELQGYAEVLRGFELPDQWMIGILLVDPAARGSGIGRAVVDAIASDARAAGAGSLAAGVIALRERSLAFWRREGFTREVRRRPITIGDVATEVVRLERALGQAAEDSMTLDDYFRGRSESRVIFDALHRLVDTVADQQSERTPGRVTVDNVNHPGRTSTVDARMYQAMRDALLQILPVAPPGLTQGEMRDAVVPQLPDDLFPQGAKAGWWLKTVQLDLEAKGVIAREPSRPLRWHRTSP